MYFDDEDDIDVHPILGHQDHQDHMRLMNFLQKESQQQIQEIQDKQKLETMLDTEKSRQVAVMEKIQRLEKFREKLQKQAGKWELQETKAKSFMNISNDCDYGCSKQCYSDYNQTTVINSFVSCIAPKCKCLNQYAIQHIPEPFFNETEYNQRRLDISKKASERVSESWPTVIRKTYMDATGYDLIRDCDVQCHRDCFGIKKYVPFDTLLQCPRYRCNCWYRLDEEIQKQIPTGYLQAQDWSAKILKDCDKSCASRCMSSFGSKPEVEFCVQYKCGCKIEQGSQSDLLMERLGFNRDKYLSKPETHEETLRRQQIEKEIIDYEEDQEVLNEDNIQLERYRVIQESDGSQKVKSSEYLNKDERGYQYQQKNVTQTPHGIIEEKIIQTDLKPQALFHRLPSEIDHDNIQHRQNQMSDYEIDQSIRKGHNYNNIMNQQDPARVYHEENLNEPKNWNFYEDEFPYKDQIKIREYSYKNEPIRIREVERERYQSNINYSEFNIHVDLYPNDQVQDLIEPIGRRHVIEKEVQKYPFDQRLDFIDKQELQDYQDFLRFRKSKESLGRIQYEKDMALEEEDEEVEVEVQKNNKKEQQSKEKKSKGKSSQGKGEKNKEKKSKKSGDYVALYDIDELMVDNEMISSPYESMTVFVLLMATIVLMIGAFQAYKSFVRNYDEKNSRLIDYGRDEDINFQRLRD